MVVAHPSTAIPPADHCDPCAGAPSARPEQARRRDLRQDERRDDRRAWTGDDRKDVGLSVVGRRVICSRHQPCASGQAAWTAIRRYGGDAARFAFVTNMWLDRGFAGQYAGQVEQEFIAAHLSEEQRRTQEAQAARARAMRPRGRSHRRNPAEASIGGSPVEVAS